MPFNQERYTLLYDRFVNDMATADEVRELWELWAEIEESEELTNAVYHMYEEPVPEEISARDWSHVEGKIFSGLNTKKRGLQWLAVAASVIIILGVGLYLQKGKQRFPEHTGRVTEKKQIEQDVVAPAVSFATLTLGNGKVIAIDSAAPGLIAMQNEVAINKSSGAIQYSEQAGNHAAVSWNTLSNPRGSRVIQIILSDGSKVWLNAASSLTFPVSFADHQRKVTVTGEAYFEVASDKTKKFIVQSGNVYTEVLGTRFNINSFDDEENQKITLLEGSVKLSGSGGKAILKPGEQAVVSQSGFRVAGDADLERTIAWKEEIFSFRDTNIRSIMKEIARWYDVDVEFRGNMQGLNFGGSMSRQKNVSEFLKRMEATQAVRFEVNGKKITAIAASN